MEGEALIELQDLVPKLPEVWAATMAKTHDYVAQHGEVDGEMVYDAAAAQATEWRAEPGCSLAGSPTRRLGRR